MCAVYMAVYTKLSVRFVGEVEGELYHLSPGRPVDSGARACVTAVWA